MNNMNTNTTFALRLGIAMLMIFVWAMPLLATSLPTPDGFRSTSPYKLEATGLEATYQGNNFGYKTYTSTIYDPFGNQTPSSGGGGNPANNDGNGSGEDVGIPDWGDTPSEPLPIADGTLFLLLIAAMMITIIAIKQRKQKQLQSITTNNNNNPTQHMTTRKQTYQSFFQKLFLLLAFCGFATNTFAWKPIMIGHRGSRMGVENTEAAFINGVTYYGFQGLETDVKITKDGHYVCWHDDVIPNENISNKAYGVDIKTNTLTGLQGCDLTQTRNGVTYTGKICTVDRYLEICKQLNVIPVIELKENATICNTNMTGFPGLYALIQKHGLVDRAIILTSMQESLKYIRTNYPQLKCQYLIYYATEDKDADAVTYGYHYSCRKDADNSLTKERVQALQNKGIEVAVWSINDNDTYTKYCNMGVNMITSDYLVVPNLPDITTTPNPNPVTTSTSTVIYFRPGTTNFSSGRDMNDNSNYSDVFWIKNGYVAMAINNPTTTNTIYIGEGRKKDEITSTNVSNRFLSMTVPEGYTQIAAYRLDHNYITSHDDYATWNKSSNISNRIPVKGQAPHFIDIPTNGKNLLVHYEGYWNHWYWAYYLPKNNDVCIYFANTGEWTKVRMLTGKDIYTFPTAEFTLISGTKLRYLSLAGNEYGYTDYGFINSSSDKLSKGWQSGLIPPVNWSTSNNSTHAFTGNRHTQGDANVTATSANKTTFNINVDKLSDNLIADRIKDAPNYTGLRDDLLKGINLFTPTSSTNGSEVAKTPITSWQDLNHKQYVTTYGGGSVTIASHKLNGATSTTSTSSTISSGTTSIQAAYTATVTLTATPNKHCAFLGWYDENWVEKSTATTYTYTASNSEKALYAVFGAKIRFRTQTFTDDKDDNKYNGDDWPNTNEGGTLTIEYTKTNSTTHTETIDKNGWSDYYTDIHPEKTLKVKANPKTGYVFVGFWNNLGYPVTTNPWEITNPENINDDGITARFAKTFPQTVNVYTYNSGTGTFDMQGTHGGSVTIEYPKVTNTNAGCEQATATTTTTWTDNVVAGTMTLTATAEEGYTFMGWYEGSTCVGTNASLEYAVESSRTINAYFATGQTNRNFSVRTMIYNGSLIESLDGGTFTMTHSGGITYTHAKIGSQNILVSNAPVTFVATPNSGYEFIGWFNVDDDKRYPDKSWTIDDPTNTTKYKEGITAIFASSETYAKKQNINIEGSGTVEANYIFYKDGTNKTTTFEQSSSFVAWAGSKVTLTAAPLAGYKLDGWYEGGNEITEGVDGNKLTYTADDAKTITAKFVSEINKLTVSVLNYNPEYDKFEEYGYEYNTITLKQGSNVLKESYSSFSHEFNDATSVTLTATPESDEETGYDFIGWYQNGEQISTATEISVSVIGMQAISAHFAPKKCWRVILDANAWGKYTLQYSKDSKFSTFKSIESSYTQPIYTFVPYKAYVKVSSVQPIHGYTCLRYKRGGSPAAIGTPIQCSANNHNIQVEFVRDEEQVVYLNLKGNGGNIPSSWSTSTPDQYAYYAFVDNEFYSTDIKRKWIRMEHVNDYCYRCTISPANRFNKVNFVQVYIDSNGKPTTKDGTPVSIVLDNNETYSLIDIRDTYKVQKVRSGAQTIPSTRNNCYRLSWSWNSTTGKNENAWTEPPTQVGDFRLVYIEQTVTDKNNITVDYTFDNAGLIKKKANSQDIISLHIYNKVSDDGTIDGMNNPEVILQRCTGFVDGKSQWEDVERRMVFGPLRATDEGVIRMPGRRNAATTTVVYDNGIDNIKNNDEDNGSGVWNFVISQDGNGNATILAKQTLRYTGDYYIRTTNADGQYNNYTHPGNIMTYSKYAADNSDYTDYFIRYVDINEDGTDTAEPGKHPVIKFAIANDHSVYLNHELMINNDRFTDDEYEVDKFAVDKGGAPNLPADASVRFGWDRVTNRLTRAYIANTTIKNNEYLVVDGTNIGNPSGDNKYFTDNSNWLYTIDLNATKNATANVKAKMNGQHQYFMENEPLIIGNGEGTYPIRLLYDFKDDRFTTIYRPNAALSGTVNLETPVMIEREHNNAPTQIQFNQGAQITVNGDFDKPAYAVMTFLEEKLASKDITHHEKMFYWVSFPFDVKISDVFGLGKYGQYWIMQRYDGAQRAASGLAQNNWKYITNTGYTLKKNIGYVICLNYNQILQDQLFKSYGGNASQLNNGKLSLYFPSNSVINPEDISLQTDPVVVNLDAHPIGANIAWNHWNWHLIGVPSFATPGLTRNQTETPFLYEYYHPTDGYAAIANGKEGKLLPMHSYMVQYAGDITWESVVNTSTHQGLAAKASAEDKPVMLRLELQQAGSTLDKTYVQLRSDKGTLGFDLNLDLSKIINAGSNIYSVVSGDQMAGNAIPKEETILPIGVVTSAAGEYTFAMPEGTEGMLVELIDYEQGTAMNLLMSDYIVTLPKGTFDQRFALRLKPDKVATSVDNIDGGTTSKDAVRKYLIDGVLYLQKGNMLYDAQGHAL